MSRFAVGFDRLVTLVLGLVLVIVGAGAVAWERGWLPDADRRTLRAPWLTGATAAPWWPWAVGAAGVVLVLLGLRWLLTHGTHPKAGRAELAGSGPEGRLDLDLGAAASAAAGALERGGARDGVLGATGRALTEHRTTTLELDLTVASTADLAAVARRADETAGQLVRAIGPLASGETPAVRTLVRIADSGPAGRDLA